MAEILDSVKILTDDDKGRLYDTIGTVTSILVDKTFYYPACRDCKKKVSDNFCVKCGTNTTPILSYRFCVCICDGSGSLWAHVFGEQGDVLLGMSPDEIKAVASEEHVKLIENTKTQVRVVREVDV